MRRIGLTVVLALTVLAPLAGDAQQTGKVHRVGWLEVGGPGSRRPNFDIFRARLGERGYVERKNSSSSSDSQIADTKGCRG